MPLNDVITHQLDEQKTMPLNDLITYSVDVNEQNCHTQTATQTATNQTEQQIQEVSTSKNSPNKKNRENSSHLLNKHISECCIKRGLDRSWIEAGCSSLTINEASQELHYTAKSPGILIEGANGQYQFKPDKPWADKQGKKAPKYRTAAGDEYDALLPAHPTDKLYWLDIEALKKRCYQINDCPMLLVTEGGFKAISTCSHGIPTVALLGVEMGLTSSKDDPQGKRYLVSELERFAKLGFGFIFAFDADTYSKKPVKQALIKLARQIQKFEVPVYNLPQWNESEGKGIDDYIQNQGIEEFRKQLLSQAIDFDRWYDEYGSDAFNKKPPKPDIIGGEIAEKYRDRWVYCDELKTWLAYGLETKGIWTIVSKQYLAAEVHAILKARNIKGYGTNAYVQNIVGALERELFIRKWNEQSSTDWLPFRNGVLELATNKLHSHSPGFRFTWQLPRDYTIVETGWQHIDNWLDEATQGNEEYKQLLLCFAAAVLRGRNDLQKFLHLIGGGGSGKSTFTTLLTALIGEENTATLNLPDLEDKHEIARIFGKRLVVLPDQDKAPRKMSNFKRLTGQDRLSGRRLFENGFEFVFGGLTVITSNFPLFHTNIGSWLTRRVTMIPFNYQCPNSKKRDLMKDMKPELGAFTSYLLSIPAAKIEAALKGIKGDRSLSPTVWESQIRSDGLAAWVNDWVIEDRYSRVPIGSNSKEWTTEDYVANNSTLYGSYALYCQQSNRSAKSPQNFSAELLELTNRTLGWQTEKARVKIAGKTVRVIKGLRLRSPHDTEPTTEEILEGSGSSLEVSSRRTTHDGSETSPPVSSVYEPRDSQVDNQGDNLGDNPKPPPNKSDDRGDNPSSLQEKNQDNFLDPCDNSETVTLLEEVETNISLDNSSLAVTPVTLQSQQGLEAVTPSVTPAVTPAVNPELNWQSYPYNSSDRYTLENRAKKVKERVLNCATSNQLNELLFSSKATELELDWLIDNYFTSTEIQQLEQIKNSTQGNLFTSPQPEEVEIIEIDFNDIKADMDLQMQRIGWSTEQGRQYLIDTYGKRSRLHLTDEELLEFWDYLKLKN